MAEEEKGNYYDMQCAVCDSRLVQQSFNDISVEYCENCSGYWFDGDEITSVLDRLIKNPDLWISHSQQKIERNLECGYCPKCNQIAKPLTLYKKNYSFLKCVRCNGIWIDKSNLNSLLIDMKKNKSALGKYLFLPHKQPEYIQGEDSFESYVGWVDDENPVNRIPFSTILLIILNLIGFFIWDPIITFNKEILFTPSAFLSNPLTYWSTIFVSMFAHANLGHLAGNMIFLYLFGDNVEDRIGHYKYLFLYLLLGILSSLGYAYLTPHPNIPTLGASGAVSGILGCYFLLYPNVNMKIHKSFFGIPYSINVPIWMYLGVWFLGQQLFGIAANVPGIAWHAHLIGFFGGYLVMYLMRKLNFL